MSTEQDLNIRLQLIDKISANLAKVQQNLKNTKDKTDSLGQSMKKVANDISHVSTSMIFLGSAITTPFLASFNKAAESSLGYANTVERVKISLENLNFSIAQSLAPLMERFAGIIQNLVTMWEKLSQPLRDSIIQTTLLTGVFLILAGTVGKIVANVIKLTASFIGFLQSANPVVVAIVAIVAALVTMAAYWEKVRNVAFTVLNAIESFLTALSIGFKNLEIVVLSVLSSILAKAQEVFRFLAKAPGKQQNVFLALAEGAGAFQAKLAAAGQSARRDIDLLETHLESLMKGDKGLLADGLETTIQTIRDKIEQIKKTFGSIFDPQNLPDVKKTFDGWSQIARSTASAMSSAMGDGFFNIMKGKFSELKNVAASFGDSILKTLSQVLAKFILVKTLGAAVPGLIPFFHQGGVVRKAHTGTIASDEVPIIAQAGEGIISKRGMQALGRDNFNKINSGMGGGGRTMQVSITQVIQAWDTSDIYRNKKQLANAVAVEIANNATIREVMRKYK